MNYKFFHIKKNIMSLFDSIKDVFLKIKSTVNNTFSKIKNGVSNTFNSDIVPIVRNLKNTAVFIVSTFHFDAKRVIGFTGNTVI